MDPADKAEVKENSLVEPPEIPQDVPSSDPADKAEVPAIPVKERTPSPEEAAASTEPLLDLAQTTVTSLKAWLKDHEVDYVGKTKKADLYGAYKNAWNLAKEPNVEPDIDDDIDDTL